MAKGRKLTTSRSERLLGSYSYGQGQGTANDVSELGEEDVWSMVDNMSAGGEEHSINCSFGEWETRVAPQNGGVSIRPGRRVPRDDRHVGGLSLAFEDPRGDQVASPRIVQQYRGSGDGVPNPRGRHLATSAPVNVPDWSKIYRVDSVESLHDLDDGTEDRDSEMVPPHEYLAREYRKMVANSVFEGAGRTLKGRDMRRVRDAVWSQTGFDG